VKTHRGRTVAWLLLVSLVVLCLPLSQGSASARSYDSHPVVGDSNIAMQVLAPIAIIYLVAVYPGQRAKAKAAHEKAQQEQREIAGVAKTLEDPDPAVADAGVQMLAKYGQKAGPAAGALLANSDPRVRARAVSALAIIGGPAAVPPLAKALSDSDPAIRTAAIDALTAKPDRAAGRVLIEALSNRDPAIRAKAATGLGALRERSAVRPLERVAATDSDETVRDAAKSALAAIRSPVRPSPAPAGQEAR